MQGYRRAKFSADAFGSWRGLSRDPAERTREEELARIRGFGVRLRAFAVRREPDNPTTFPRHDSAMHLMVQAAGLAGVTSAWYLRKTSGFDRDRHRPPT